MSREVKMIRHDIEMEIIIETEAGKIEIPPIVVPDDWEYTVCKIRLSKSCL